MKLTENEQLDMIGEEIFESNQRSVVETP